MAKRILIVDDHPMMCDALRLMMETFPGAEVAGVCGDCATAWRLTGELQPDLVLMDVDLPDGSGIALTRRIRAGFPSIKILVLTGHVASRVAAEAIDAGAQGYLAKTSAADELLTVVRLILEGDIRAGAELLTAGGEGVQPAVAAMDATSERIREALPLREGQVLELVIKGLRNKEIAAELNLNVKTVETYRSRLMKRYDCDSPAELVRHAIRIGLAVA